MKGGFLSKAAKKLVAAGAWGTARKVQIPRCKWKADDGTLINGPVQRTFDVPLGRLLYFERQ